MFPRLLLAVLCLLSSQQWCSADPLVVLNEVRQDGDEFIELYNPGNQAIDLRGYTLVGDVSYVFADKRDVISPGNYLVLALETPSARKNNAYEIYSWLWTRISNRGGLIKLYDPNHQLVDLVRYGEAQPGLSYQRRDPRTDYTGPQNWAYAKPTLRGPNSNRKDLSVACADQITRPPQRVRSHQPIQISARVFLPKDLQTVQLMWGTKNSNWKSVAMKPTLLRETSNAEYKVYTAQIPPQPSETFVRYKVEVTSLSGQKDFIEVDPLSGKEFYYFVFDQLETRHRSYCIQIPQESIKELLFKPGKKRFPADLVMIDKDRIQVVGPVQIQVKGGTWTTRWKKRNWLIRLPKGTTIDGARFLTWRPNWYDTTYSRELMACKLYKLAGVPVSRAQHVRVQVNSEFFGLYTQVETIDENFLSRNGLGNGVLYKPFDSAKNRDNEEWCDGRRYDTLEDYTIRWEKKTYIEEPYSDLQKFIEGYHDCPEDQLKEYFDQNLDVERYLRYLAINVLLSHWDSIAKNYMWVYDRENTKKWVVLPWDVDQTWGKGMTNEVKYVTTTIYYGTEDHKIGGWRKWWHKLRDKVLKVPAYRDRLNAHIEDFLDRGFLRQDFARKVKDIGPERELDLIKWGTYLSEKNDEGLRDGQPYSPKFLVKDLEQIKLYCREREDYLREHIRREKRGLASAVGSGPLEHNPATFNNLWPLLAALGLVLLYVFAGGAKEDRL